MCVCACVHSCAQVHVSHGYGGYRLASGMVFGPTPPHILMQGLSLNLELTS